MNNDNFALSSKIVGESYVSLGVGNRRCLEKKIHHLLEQRKLPLNGWSDLEIRQFLNEMSLMDSNNFTTRCGVGEREGRIYNSIVAERHFNFSHGIGRSGDVAAIQPKAAGSSLINKVSNALVLDVIKFAGVPSTTGAAIIPCATGMTLTLCFLFLKKTNQRGKFIIWPRIDQKSCFKAILTAGFTPLIVEPKVVGDELQTDVEAIRNLLDRYGEEILTVFCTTSCFAPRICDNIVDVSRICKERGVPHIINNAYGVQGKRCMNLIQKGHEVGRIDAFVQSTDKNFLVPVGGAIVASKDAKTVDDICKLYPGRASATPSLDVLITLLGLGRKGVDRLIKERQECLEYLRTKVTALAEVFGERVLTTPGNPISLAMTLSRVPTPSEVGSMLFTRGCSGARVVAPGTSKDIEGFTFENFGSHSRETVTPYINCASAIGQSKDEIDTFVEKLETVLKKKSNLRKET